MKKFMHKIGIGSVWTTECFRSGKLLWTEIVHNVMTDEGLTEMLEIMFHSGTQLTAWYVGIFEDNYTPLITNVYATPGFTESTAYDESVRQTFVPAAAAAKSITNAASKATFTMNATKTIYGGFLVAGGTDADTKADAAGGGILMCSAQFDTSKAVVSADVLKVTVTISASDV